MTTELVGQGGEPMWSKAKVDYVTVQGVKVYEFHKDGTPAFWIEEDADGRRFANDDRSQVEVFPEDGADDDVYVQRKETMDA